LTRRVRDRLLPSRSAHRYQRIARPPPPRPSGPAPGQPAILPRHGPLHHAQGVPKRPQRAGDVGVLCAAVVLCARASIFCQSKRSCWIGQNLAVRRAIPASRSAAPRKTPAMSMGTGAGRSRATRATTVTPPTIASPGRLDQCRSRLAMVGGLSRALVSFRTSTRCRRSFRSISCSWANHTAGGAAAKREIKSRLLAHCRGPVLLHIGANGTAYSSPAG
jgi:hypothetical protein